MITYPPDIEVKCPKCKLSLYVVVETTIETPYKLKSGNKTTGIFSVEKVAEPRAKPETLVKVLCLGCKSRFYSIEYGKLVAPTEFRFSNPHTNYINFDALNTSSTVEIPHCFTPMMFRLCERPRDENGQ